MNASDSYKYDFDVFRDEMSESPNPYIQLPGPELMDRSAQIIIKREIAGDELTVGLLTFFSQLCNRMF